MKLDYDAATLEMLKNEVGLGDDSDLSDLATARRFKFKVKTSDSEALSRKLEIVGKYLKPKDWHHYLRVNLDTVVVSGASK